MGTLTGATMDVAYSPDQKHLVTADSNRKVTLFSAGGGYDKPNNREWGFHTAKVNCVAWAPNSVYVASGGLDTSIILWSVEAPDKHCIIRNPTTRVRSPTLPGWTTPAWSPLDRMP